MTKYETDGEKKAAEKIAKKFADLTDAERLAVQNHQDFKRRKVTLDETIDIITARRKQAIDAAKRVEELKAQQEKEKQENAKKITALLHKREKEEAALKKKLREQNAAAEKAKVVDKVESKKGIKEEVKEDKPVKKKKKPLKED